MLEAYALELELEEREAAEEGIPVDFIALLRGVKGVNFCCGVDGDHTAFDETHMLKIARHSRSVFVNRATLPDYDYDSYKSRNRPAANADERHLITLRREKDRSSSVHEVWRKFYAHEGVAMAQKE